MASSQTAVGPVAGAAGMVWSTWTARTVTRDRSWSASSGAIRSTTWSCSPRPAASRTRPANSRPPWSRSIGFLPSYQAEPVVAGGRRGDGIAAVLGHAPTGVVGDLGGDAGRLAGAGRGVVDDGAEQAHVLVGAVELLAGGGDAALERHGFQQGGRRRLAGRGVGAFDVLRGELGHWLGQGDHFAKDGDVWLELRDIGGDQRRALAESSSASLRTPSAEEIVSCSPSTTQRARETACSAANTASAARSVVSFSVVVPSHRLGDVLLGGGRTSRSRSSSPMACSRWARASWTGSRSAAAEGESVGVPTCSSLVDRGHVSVTKGKVGTPGRSPGANESRELPGKPPSQGWSQGIDSWPSSMPWLMM